MTYWTNRNTKSGYREGFRYTDENIRRLRANLGRGDAAVHPVGGIADAIARQTSPGSSGRPAAGTPSVGRCTTTRRRPVGSGPACVALGRGAPCPDAISRWHCSSPAVQRPRSTPCVGRPAIPTSPAFHRTSPSCPRSTYARSTWTACSPASASRCRGSPTDPRTGSDRHVPADESDALPDGRGRTRRVDPVARRVARRSARSTVDALLRSARHAAQSGQPRCPGTRA